MRVLHCLNQFFGGLGGEEQAGVRPQLFDGARGPGRLFESLAPDVAVVASVVFGDDDAAERGEAAVDEILDLLQRWIDAHPDAPADLVLAGPAFRAGRYGLTCGAICHAVETSPSARCSDSRAPMPTSISGTSS